MFWGILLALKFVRKKFLPKCWSFTQIWSFLNFI